MSVIREVEERITQYGGINPLSHILSEAMRPQDYPIDPILYGNIVAAFSDYYARVLDAKSYQREMAEINNENNEGDTE